jgi:hypothetical protein
MEAAGQSPSEVTVADKDRKTTEPMTESDGGATEPQSEHNSREFEAWLEIEPSPADSCGIDELSPWPEASAKSRLDRIKQSHALLRQFTPKELGILLSLKRNTSPKAWTLREDLVVLTLNLSNRDIADVLKDRNKEAVKKRLQLLRSKGLSKRHPEVGIPQS